MGKIKILVVLMICSMILCACSQNEKSVELDSKFVGSWQCTNAPIEHSDYYTGYLVLSVNKDGSFSMYDAEAGNPGIEGTVRIISENELQLDCNTEDDFDPPVTWNDMKEKQKLTYEFVTDKELRLCFAYENGKSTLAFTKME